MWNIIACLIACVAWFWPYRGSNTGYQIQSLMY